MRYATMQQMILAAEMYGGQVRWNAGNPVVDLSVSGEESFGIESTEVDTDDDGQGNVYGGFRYFGPRANMDRPEVTACFNYLTLPVVKKELLTITQAQELMGRKVRLSYCDVNEGEYIIIIDGMERKHEPGTIGQDYCEELRFREVLPDGTEKPGTWIYEWQGVFRRGSGAERLFVEEVYGSIRA